MTAHPPPGPPPSAPAEKGGGSRGELVPWWFRRTVAFCGGLLIVAATVGVLGWIALQVALVTLALIVALLLAALLAPLARLLNRLLPAWLAAALSVVVLLATVAGIGFLLEQRIRAELGSLAASLTASVDGIRNWLVTGPLALQPQQVNEVRNRIVGAIQAAAPSGVTAASTVISVLSGAAIALFVLFFVLKDGDGMWRSLVAAAPAGHQERIANAGRRAWDTLTRYVQGVVVIALVDATLTGVGLFVLGVPLALSLTVLVFLGGFVPLLGATISGAVAVLVALVARGPVTALIVLGIVLFVQNVEGNILQPFVQSRAVRLHPVVILVSVTVGMLLFGVAGAVVAVPFVAVVRTVVVALRTTAGPEPDGRSNSSPTEDGPAPSGTGTAEPRAEAPSSSPLPPPAA